jgi:hypothetical protein
MHKNTFNKYVEELGGRKMKNDLPPEYERAIMKLVDQINNLQDAYGPAIDVAHDIVQALRGRWPR